MTVNDPALVPLNSLYGLRVALSVSESSDLARLGLDDRHADLAIAELARALILAGAKIVYGGRLQPSGFTHQLINETERFAPNTETLTICLAAPEHVTLNPEEFEKVDARFGTWGRIVRLDTEGVPLSTRSREVEPIHDSAAAYRVMRRYVTENSDARVVVGGKLRGYSGDAPGVLEEIQLSLEADQPVFLAGGFGGAALAAAQALGGPFDWLPADLPEGTDDEAITAVLTAIIEAANGASNPTNPGLEDHEQAQLAASHRPGEVASLTVLGLSRWFLASKDQNAAG